MAEKDIRYNELSQHLLRQIKSSLKNIKTVHKQDILKDAAISTDFNSLLRKYKKYHKRSAEGVKESKEFAKKVKVLERNTEKLLKTLSEKYHQVKIEKSNPEEEEEKSIPLKHHHEGGE